MQQDCIIDSVKSNPFATPARNDTLIHTKDEFPRGNEGTKETTGLGIRTKSQSLDSSNLVRCPVIIVRVGFWLIHQPVWDMGLELDHSWAGNCVFPDIQLELGRELGEEFEFVDGFRA